MPPTGARARINLSWGSDTNLVTGGGDRFFDEMVHNRWRTIVKSAGNRNCGNTGGPGGTPDADVTSPGLAYNVITVGGLDDHGHRAVERRHDVRLLQLR